jgi:nucleotide-binding universal stress UspA family protein
MKILICSDGSLPAENAISFLAPVAGNCHAEVTLLGIIENPGDEMPLHDALKRGAQILRDRGVSVELITKNGHAIEEIQRRAGENSYDLVAIGAARKGADGPLWMAAKVYKIIKLIQPPVLAVIGKRAGLKRILICSGGRSYIDKAVELVKNLACGGGVSVTILHVMPELPAMYADLLERDEDVSEMLASKSTLGRSLSTQKKALEDGGITTSVRLRHGLVVPEVFREIDDGDYDLVVTGSSLASGPIQTYIMGNVTSEIVNRADCPVLVVRSGSRPRSLISKVVRVFRKK